VGVGARGRNAGRRGDTDRRQRDRRRGWLGAWSASRRERGCPAAKKGRPGARAAIVHHRLHRAGARPGAADKEHEHQLRGGRHGKGSRKAGDRSGLTGHLYCGVGEGGELDRLKAIQGRRTGIGTRGEGYLQAPISCRSRRDSYFRPRRARRRGHRRRCTCRLRGRRGTLGGCSWGCLRREGRSWARRRCGRRRGTDQPRRSTHIGQCGVTEAPIGANRALRPLLPWFSPRLEESSREGQLVQPGDGVLDHATLVGLPGHPTLLAGESVGHASVAIGPGWPPELGEDNLGTRVGRTHLVVTSDRKVASLLGGRAGKELREDVLIPREHVDAAPIEAGGQLPRLAAPHSVALLPPGVDSADRLSDASPVQSVGTAGNDLVNLIEREVQVGIRVVQVPRAQFRPASDANNSPTVPRVRSELHATLDGRVVGWDVVQPDDHDDGHAELVGGLDNVVQPVQHAVNLDAPRAALVADVA
jgi:hypothetical protein